MRYLLAVLVLVGVFASGCTADTAPATSPTTPIPTPNIAATVAAEVQAALAAIPSPTPSPSPTNTPLPTLTPSLTASPTPTPTPTVAPAPTPTNPPPSTPTFAELNQQLLTQEELNQQLIIWDQGSVPDYQIIYQDIGASRQGNTEPVIITVRNQSVTSVAYQEDGRPVTERSYPTVEQLFALVSGALSGQHRIVKVTFDPDLGYPTSVSLASNQPGEPQSGFTAKVHLVPSGSQSATYGPSPEALAAIKALHWVSDALTSSERAAVSALRHLARASEQAFEDLMAKGWMVEGWRRSPPYWATGYPRSGCHRPAGQRDSRAAGSHAFPHYYRIS